MLGIKEERRESTVRRSRESLKVAVGQEERAMGPDVARLLCGHKRGKIYDFERLKTLDDSRNTEDVSRSIRSDIFAQLTFFSLNLTMNSGVSWLQK